MNKFNSTVCSLGFGLQSDCDVRDESAGGPDLAREEVRRDHGAPMRTEKRLPRRLALASWWNPPLLEDGGYG